VADIGAWDGERCSLRRVVVVRMKRDLSRTHGRGCWVHRTWVEPRASPMRLHWLEPPLRHRLGLNGLTILRLSLASSSDNGFILWRIDGWVPCWRAASPAASRAPALARAHANPFGMWALRLDDLVEPDRCSDCIWRRSDSTSRGPSPHVSSISRKA
jgi:hypothetical protein